MGSSGMSLMMMNKAIATTRGYHMISGGSLGRIEVCSRVYKVHVAFINHSSLLPCSVDLQHPLMVCIEG